MEEGVERVASLPACIFLLILMTVLSYQLALLISHVSQFLAQQLGIPADFLCLVLASVTFYSLHEALPTSPANFPLNVLYEDLQSTKLPMYVFPPHTDENVEDVDVGADLKDDTSPHDQSEDNTSQENFNENSDEVSSSTPKKQEKYWVLIYNKKTNKLEPIKDLEPFDETLFPLQK